MKFKTTAIALAVAGTVAAPVAVQAGADEIYASARVGIWNVDTQDQSQWDVRSFASRFGARGETDLGNGLTGYGRYEWDVDFNNDLGEDDISVRQRWVGLKGGFGSVQIGQGYWTFYNHVVGPNDIPWWHSGYAMVMYRGRTDNAVTYAGGGDAVTFGVSAYMTPDAEEEEIDIIEGGVSFGIGDMTLGLALISVADDAVHGSAGNDEDIIGAALSGISFGNVSMGFGAQIQDDDSSFLAHFDIGNVYIHVEQLSVDASDQDILGLTLGYTHSLGRKTTMYFEGFALDADTGNSDDDITRLMAVLKYDII